MAQATYLAPNQQVPGKIFQQAATNGMGELGAVYKPKYSNPLAIIGIMLAILIVDIAAIVAIYALGFIVYYLIIIPIIAIIWGISTLLNCNLRVYIFTNGFINARGGRTQAVRWDQVQAIWEKVTQSRYGNTFTYTVQSKDGRVLKQGSPLVKSRDMGMQMMREVTKLHLPAAKAAYNAGQRLSFGKINVDLQGLNNGKELVPWDQIGRVSVKQGKVSIEKDGRLLKWSSVKAAEIPNLSVLIALVTFIVQGQK